MRRVHLIVYGHVQGVGYRNFAVNMAKKLEINGWIRNLQDGSVEVIAQGQTDKIDEFLSLCKIGPSKAKVNEIKQLDEYRFEDLNDFKISYI
ncbi:acylphosphatase [Candidatus Bathyarchaeota archaeon]|nr:acylphosphatase [Candidatus Bathyarchaeota archaeon]